MSGKFNGGKKTGAGKPFVIPDRKAGAGGQQPAKPKPSNGKPFVIPERKPANVPAARSTSPGPVSHNKGSKPQTGNAKHVAPQRKHWWETAPSLQEKDLILLEDGKPWYSSYPKYLDDIAFDKGSVNLNGDRLAAAIKTVTVAHQQQLKLYAEWLKNSTEMKSDVKWMNDMIKSGTMSDKVAAMTLKVQSSPFHELETLDVLIAMALRKEQRAAQLAMEALKDLFVNNLLPDRPLRTTDAHGLNHPEMDLRTAQLVWFESQIKTRYEKLLEALELGLKSNVDYFKRECLQTASELLIGKPEQEGRLLAMLVNKLGDPSRATCSKAIEVLKQVMRAHPAMKIVIVREVRQFLYRPNLKIRPVFNGIILLSQVQLQSKADHAVAVQLVEGYLSLFEKTMKEEEYGSRLLSALLTGINKALPYLQNTDSLEKYVDPLFKIVHTATSFSTATQALMLLSHLALAPGSSGSAQAKAAEGTAEAGQESGIVKRYYRALYAKLLSEQITTRTRNTLFLNLLYRSIKGDSVQHRAMAFVKRLLICAAQSVPPIAAGLLFLVSEVMKARPELKICLNDTPEGSDHDNSSNGADRQDVEEAGYLGNFNVSKREPEFAYAPGAVPTVWELALLARHFHPSVQSFTKSLAQDAQHQIVFNGDPTVDFSLMAFLNRFAYKNPKKSALEKIKHRLSAQAKEEPINIAMAHPDATAGAVEPDKQFFFKYFSDKSRLVAEGRARDKSKHHADGGDHRDGDEDSDATSLDGSLADRGDNDIDSDPDEAEIDRFADKLAEDLRRSAAGNAGDKDDDFDFSEEDDSDDGSAVQPDEVEGAAEGDSDSEAGLDWDGGLGEERSDDDSDSEDEPTSQSKKGEVSSRALDFEDFVAEQKAKATSGKSKKQSEDDSSDDGYALEAFGDEGMEVEDDGGESLLGSVSEGDAGESDAEDDPEEGDSDEEGEFDAGSEEGSDGSDVDSYDSAEEEALERAALEDSGDEGGRSNKHKFGKRSRRDDDSAFASAEDYEEMMEEIVQKVRKPQAFTATANAEPQNKDQNKAQNKAQGKKGASTPAPVQDKKGQGKGKGAKQQQQTQPQQGTKRKGTAPAQTAKGDKKLRK